MPTWFWFAIAAIAACGGALLLLSDRARAGDRTRDRRRWAEEKSWDFEDVDPVLPSRWRYGAVHQGGPGRALDVATGAVPGPGGRRLAHVFDHEQAGQVTGIVAAVRGIAALPVAIELRLPSAPLPDDAALDSLGQVGERYAFVTHLADARPLATAELARTADAVGSDVALLWAEENWVLATVDAGADPERVQALLQALVEVSVALEDAVEGPDDLEPTHDPFADLEPETDESDGPDRTDEPRTDDTRIAGADRGTPSRETRGAGRPTHQDSPAEVPYDIEDEGFGPGARTSSTGR